MIAGFGLILLCQLVGEAIVHAVAVPVPGPVAGLILLLMLLLLRDRAPRLAVGPLTAGRIEPAAKGLLAHLSLLFVPAGVGIVQQFDLLKDHGAAIVAVLAASVVLTLLTTVGTFLLLSRYVARRRAS